MSISSQTLAQIFDYLVNYWNTDLTTVQSEYNSQQFTITEDDEDPDKFHVNHSTREDIIVLIDEL